MVCVIVGGGRVGLRTAHILAEEGFEVVLVERDPDRVERIREEGLSVVMGDGADADVLAEAGIERADAVAGLTADLNTNFAACLIGAKHGARTVMRIDEDYREEIYEKYADEVDEIIYPEQLGATGAKTALLGGNFNLIADLTEELQLFTVHVPEGSPAVDKLVIDLDDLIGDEHARVYAHGPEHQALTIPLPGTTIQPGDQIAVIAERDAVDGVRESLLGEAAEAPSG